MAVMSENIHEEALRRASVGYRDRDASSTVLPRLDPTPLGPIFEDARIRMRDNNTT
jgi:hypothetical protein